MFIYLSHSKKKQTKSVLETHHFLHDISFTKAILIL